MRTLHECFSRNVLISALIGFAIGFAVTFLPGHKIFPDHKEYARKHPTSIPVRCVFGLFGALVLAQKEWKFSKQGETQKLM